MIRIHRHDDVVRLEMSTRRSRTVGVAVSAFLVRGVMIDTGFPGIGDDVERLLSSERLQGVMVTHWHEDHAGNLDRVVRRGIPVAAHADTLARSRAAERIPVYRRWTWGQPLPFSALITPLDVDGLELIATPGHSADHHVVWDRTTGSLFAGDLFIGVKVRVAHHDESPRALVASLRRVLALQPARVFDAHRGLLPDALAALRAKADWTEEIIARVTSMAREGAPPSRIEREVLGARESTDYVSFGEYSRASLVRAILHESSHLAATADVADAPAARAESGAGGGDADRDAGA
ncbi:MAG: MBL fold metallo-hydrolase [Gemmatimonadaceae bacterium]|nr:MBL fold metallo-hydrolase [Gemmatimonadaceae bacterium]